MDAINRDPYTVQAIDERTYTLTISGRRIYYDRYLQYILDKYKRMAKNDWDIFCLYDGYEGTGKSVKAMQDALYVDHTFNLDRVCFTAKEFQSCVENGKKYQAIVYDEAYTGLHSRDTMSMINKTLVKLIAEMRQKRLFVFIVMPTFFDLDKYTAIWRSRYLIHVVTNKYHHRGFFRYYSRNAKKDLYMKGKKLYDYNVRKAQFVGRFSNQYAVDEEAYRKKKAEALLKNDGGDENVFRPIKVKAQIFDRLMQWEDFRKLSVKEQTHLLGIQVRTYSVWKRRIAERGKAYTP